MCARTFSFAAVALDGEAGGLLLTTLIRFVPVLLVWIHTHTRAGHSQYNTDSAHGAWNQPMLRWASNPPIPGGRALGGWQRARGWNATTHRQPPQPIKSRTEPVFFQDWEKEHGNY